LVYFGEAAYALDQIVYCLDLFSLLVPQKIERHGQNPSARGALSSRNELMRAAVGVGSGSQGNNHVGATVKLSPQHFIHNLLFYLIELNGSMLVCRFQRGLEHALGLIGVFKIGERHGGRFAGKRS
jgi:hypothetical protein